MRTLIFCTSYASTLDKWNERWLRWMQYIIGSGLDYAEILIVDDGSPVVPDWPDVPVIRAENIVRTDAKISIHHFGDRHGQRVNGQPFPGWYRSFAHAVLYGIQQGFDRIIHIEADAFLITDRAIDFFNARDRGWITLWCPRHNWPESTLQIINRDQYPAAKEFFSKPYAAHLGEPYRPMEVLIPATEVNRSLIGDRYGEMGDFVPVGADYVSQVRWDMGQSYYWWLTNDGKRKNAVMQRPSFADLNAKYSIEVDPKSHTGVEYKEFLKFLDKQLLPQTYLEIGTHEGDSSAAVTCDAILIDPNFRISRNVFGNRRRTMMFQMTSDEFFEQNDVRSLIGPVDLGFLDGLHHYEALLKDFVNFERFAHEGSVALLHDCLPLNVRMAGRIHAQGPDSESEATRAFWTGDVWKILPILSKFRPDLDIIYIDCPPTGLVLCARLQPKSTVLMYNYNEAVQEMRDIDLAEFGFSKLRSMFPTFSSRRIIESPLLFCEYFSMRIRPFF